MVGARGFEPPTSRSQTERTTRLCYAPCPLSTANGRDILASVLRQGQGTKKFSGILECSPAVTYLIFYLGRQFGEGLIKAFRNKNRIVAEPVCATRSFDDCSIAHAP